MSKYTANDFANARFAEHEGGMVMARSGWDDFAPWEWHGFKFTDLNMSTGTKWAPVPSKPRITESQTELEEEVNGTNYWLGFRAGFVRAGGEVIPDPEPTNYDRLKPFVANSYERGWTPTQVAAYLDHNGVTAPEETK